MNFRLLVVAILVLLLGGGVLLYFKGNKPNTTASVTPTPKPTVEAMTNQSSLMDLLNLGKTQKCTFDYKASNNSETKGTVYLSGDKMRGDFNIATTSNTKGDMSMIRSGDTSYMWGSLLPGGIKMTVSAKDLASNTQAKQYVDANQKVDYKCGTWIVDSSVFTPPANIKFTDYSSLMPKTQTSGTPTGTGTSAQCAYCNYLSGDSKASCLAAYCK